MNIINKLTLRHIRSHKKRTVLTVLAIIISVAMVTAVFTSAITMVNFFREVTIAVDGDYHAVVDVENWKENSKLFDRNDLDVYAPSYYYGSVEDTTDNLNVESTMMILATREDYLSLAAIELSEGRFPENENEIFISKARMDETFPDKKLGDTITVTTRDIDGKNVQNTFRITGITNSVCTATEEYSSYTYATDETLSKQDSVNVRLRYSTLDHEIFAKTEKLAQDASEESYYYLNSELLAYSGLSADDQLIVSIGAFAAILLLIIAVVSIFMIYDSFAVSYQDRAKYLGILASVGATKRQKRSSIYFEAFILGLIGIPLGIGAGLGGIAITFKILENAIKSTLAVAYEGALHVHINWIVIVGTVIATIITLFVSAYIPARKASKTNPIDAIRQTSTVKVKKAKKLRVSPLTQKLFGFSGVMAVKNYKRNSKRSRNIVFALFLSVVVFLAATNFSAMFTRLMNSELSTSSDIDILTHMDQAEQVDKILSERTDIDHMIKYGYEYCFISTDYYKPDSRFMDYVSSVENEGEEITGQIMICFLDNASLDSYAKQVGVNPEKLHGDGFNGLLCNASYGIRDNKKYTENPLKDLKNEKLEFSYEYGNEDNLTVVKDSAFVVATTTDYWEQKGFPYTYISTPVLFTSFDNIDRFGAKLEYTNVSYSIFSENADELGDYLNEKFTEMKLGFYLNERSVEAESINNLLIIAKTFAYGFIILITLISIMNIVNTISNAMNERRREFAMIRSVGMTPKEFSKMVYLESLRYGFLALLFGLPVSVLIHFAEYKALAGSYDFGFSLNIVPYIIAIVAVFAVIFIALLYSIGRIKDDNIIETLRHE